MKKILKYYFNQMGGLEFIAFTIILIPILIIGIPYICLLIAVMLYYLLRERYSKTKKYVVGFMFNNNKDKVALIKKNKPSWQKGLLNGIGGKIEKFELPIKAMVREFKEETDLITTEDEWKCFLIATDLEIEYKVYFYFSVTCNQELRELSSTTDEEVVIVNVSEIDSLGTIPNLKWLIKMCLDRDFKFGEVVLN